MIVGKEEFDRLKAIKEEFDRLKGIEERLKKYINEIEQSIKNREEYQESMKGQPIGILLIMDMENDKILSILLKEILGEQF